MTNTAYVFGLVTFLLTLRDYVSACSCFPSHTQTHFCRSDYVIVATVKDIEDIYQDNFKQTNKIPEGPMYPYPLQRNYKARIHRVFKNGNMTSRDIVLKTPGTSAGCGVTLDRNVKYIIGGYKVDGDYWLNLCGWVQEYKSLHRQQIKGLKFLYKRNCQCEVCYMCSNGYRGSKQNSCKWEPNWSKDCYVRYGICSENKNTGTCQWKKNKQFKECLTENGEKFPWQKFTEVLPPVREENRHSPGYDWP